MFSIPAPNATVARKDPAIKTDLFLLIEYIPVIRMIRKKISRMLKPVSYLLEKG
jgi:hypothetical protein